MENQKTPGTRDQNGNRDHNRRRRRRPSGGENRPHNSENRQPRIQKNYDNSRPSRNNNPLPSPAILQEYEYASEGSAAKLIDMAREEQRRRHKWEDDFMRFHKKSLRFGQILGFLSVLVLVNAVVELAQGGYQDLASVVAVSGFGAFAFSSIFAMFGRKLARKPKNRE